MLRTAGIIFPLCSSARFTRGHFLNPPFDPALSYPLLLGASLNCAMGSSRFQWCGLDGGSGCAEVGLCRCLVKLWDLFEQYGLSMEFLA